MVLYHSSMESARKAGKTTESIDKIFFMRYNTQGKSESGAHSDRTHHYNLLV